MINNKLIEIDNYLSTPSFFDFLKSLNVDSTLDSRDEPEFDDCWMSEFNSLGKASIQDDDIEIISKSFVLGKENSWSITHLWPLYKNGKFPE